MTDPQGIRGKSADLYDVFVDWKGRLGREMPGLTKRLREAGANRILDVGCGTGRHVDALLKAGFDAEGADLSEAMLEQARSLTGEPQRFFSWRLGDDPPGGLDPYDAIISLGNVWPQLVGKGDVERTLGALRALLRPGGLVLAGLKAFAVRRESGNPYLPLLRREHEGRALHFVRFIDFHAQPPADPADDGAEIGEFHMLIADDEGDEPHHRLGRVRIWGVDELATAFESGGFVEVSVSARLDDPGAIPASEDVFVHARAP